MSFNLDELYTDKKPTFNELKTEKSAFNLDELYKPKPIQEQPVSIWKETIKELGKAYPTIQESAGRLIRGEEKPFGDIPEALFGGVAYETAGIVKGLTLGYVKPEKILEKFEYFREMPELRKKIAGVGGQLVGALAPISMISKGVGGGLRLLNMAKYSRPFISALAQGGITGGVYGLARNPEEHENRLQNARDDAGMFVLFTAGMFGIDKVIRNIKFGKTKLYNSLRQDIINKFKGVGKNEAEATAVTDALLRQAVMKKGGWDKVTRRTIKEAKKFIKTLKKTVEPTMKQAEPTPTIKLPKTTPKAPIMPIKPAPIKPEVTPTKAPVKTVYRGDIEVGRKLEAKVSTPPDLRGIYFAEDKDLAQSYADMGLPRGEKGVVEKYEIKLKNPANDKIENEVLKSFDAPQDEDGMYLYTPELADEVANVLQQRGYDGVIRETGEVIAFSPEAVKKAKPTPAKELESLVEEVKKHDTLERFLSQIIKTPEKWIGVETKKLSLSKVKPQLSEELTNEKIIKRTTNINLPILIDKNNLILDGHSRFFAKKNLGHKDILTITKAQLTAIYTKAHPARKITTPTKTPAEVVKEPAIKPTYKPTQNLTDIVKAKMKEQKGAITVSGEPIKRAATAITEAKEKIADVFTRYRNIDDVTREEFVALEEMAGKKMQDAADLSMQMIGNKYDKPTRRAIQLYMDNPAKYPVPKGTENTIREIDKLQKLHNQVLKEAGYDITEWPQSKIKYLEEEIPKLEEKLSKYKTDKAKDNVREKIKNTKEEIKKLKKLGYIHRVSRRTVAGAIRKLIREPSKIRSISARPVKFLGRTYNTIAEAEAAGIEVGDITESVAETIYSIWKTAETKALIDAINKNTAYALPASKAPSDWQRIDPRTMPSARGKRYHPAMADAIKELTYTSNLSLDRLLKLYDKINVMGKMIGFYNPIFMTNYDLQQGWRGAGIKFLFKIPEAIKIFSEKGDKYSEFMRGGLFNKVIDYKPGVDVMVKQMLDMAEKSYGIRFAEKLGDVLLHPIKGLQIFNNKTTWKIDEILRIACRLGIENQRVTKGLSAFLKTDLANDFMAAYNKLPKATKKTLNRAIFTPTYKISMMRILGKMHANPRQFTAPLIRHHSYKLFLKFVLPTIIGAWLANKYKDKITKAYSEKGYRIVVKIGDKVEKVYAISGPLLEETKITHRKPEYTLKLNLSFGLNFLNTLLNRNKGYTEPNDLKRIGEYFKIGAPGIREYLNWADKDKTTADKFLTQLGFAYAYTRIPAELVKDKRAPLIKALSAMDLWLDWRESEETRIRLKTERRYRYYSDELYKSVKRKDRKEIKELLKKSKEEFGQTFPLRNVYARIRREKRVKIPKLTREEQQLRARNRFLRTVISRKMRKESD